MIRKCRFCGETLVYEYANDDALLVYDDEDHVIMCELEALRALVDELVNWADNATPTRFMQELEPIVARAKALRSK